jgi:hypothetical protein
MSAKWYFCLTFGVGLCRLCMMASTSSSCCRLMGLMLTVKGIFAFLLSYVCTSADSALYFHSFSPERRYTGLKDLGSQSAVLFCCTSPYRFISL